MYKHLFETIVESTDQADADDGEPISVILTTHSPHIASIAPLNSLLLLRSDIGQGTKGYSTAATELSGSEEEDLSRYLDVTRAEMVFARGVILVEGDAERFLIPAFADELGISLDEHGVSVCSVAGTNFQPYVKLLCALGIPFAVITDFDEINGTPRSYKRCLKLTRIIDIARGGPETDDLIDDIEAMKTYPEAYDKFKEFGLFVNGSTLETEMFGSDYAEAMIATLREHNFSDPRLALLDTWEAKPSDVDAKILIKMIEQMGKGRFAQRLASRNAGLQVPSYIADAISYVVDLV